MKPNPIGFWLTCCLVLCSYLFLVSKCDAYYSLSNKIPLSAKLSPKPTKVHACFTENKSVQNSTNPVCADDNLSSPALRLMSADGVLEVNFKVPPFQCNYSSLELKLRVNDSITSPDLCDRNAILPESTNIHSSKIVAIEYENCTDKNCTEVCEKEIKESFRYIFPGCYQLWILPYSQQNSLDSISTSPTYFRTSYSKKKMSEYKDPEIKTKYVPDDKIHGASLIANAYFENSFFNSEQLYMSFLLLNHVDPHSELTMCYKTGIEESNCHILWIFFSCADTELTMTIVLGKEGVIIKSNKIKKLSNSHGIAECETANGVKKEYTTCSVIDRHTLNCQFFGIKPGHYCVRVDLWDERCSSGTIWSFNSSYSTPCSWHHQFVAVEPDTIKVINFSEVHKSTSLPYVLLFIGVTFFVCLLLFFGAWSSNRLSWKSVNKLFHLKNQRTYEPQNNASFTPTPDKLELILTNQPTILLVYARDCQLFMDAMVIFRNLLKTVANCQVYDCWDPNQWEKIAESSYDWVIALASDPSVRIVVVSTEIAQLVETSIQHSATMKYRYWHPECFDSIFIFAIKYIVANTISNSYKRVFITRLNGFPPDGTRFTSLNPHTIYSLPDHFHLLISALHHLGSKEFSLKDSDEEEISKFRNVIDELKKFHQNNPHYICHIIDKSVL